MLSREEIREFTSVEESNNYFACLYLNVDPMFNKKADYMVHFKNMIKNTSETLDKAVYKKVKKDLEKIGNYVLSNKRMFRKGLVLLSSIDNAFWREYSLNVPVKNELIVDKTPSVKPLLDIMDNYQKYALLLVAKESARIFVIHLGEIVEYAEMHTPDIPGKHKKGGWFALSQNHYERHVDFHIGVHLKDVAEKFDSFISREYIGRLIIGGSDEAVSMVKGMLHKSVIDKIIGNVRIEMFAKPDEVLKKVEPIVSEYEKRKEEETVESLIAKAMKNENAVLGLDNVINALQEQRVLKLIFVKDYKANGYNCSACNYLSIQTIDKCPYCNGNVEAVDYMGDLAGQKAIQQNALVAVSSENKKLMDAGGIGAFLRF